jgi:hypothetical protein
VRHRRQQPPRHDRVHRPGDNRPDQLKDWFSNTNDILCQRSNAVRIGHDQRYCKTKTRCST